MSLKNPQVKKKEEEFIPPENKETEFYNMFGEK